MDMSNMRVVTDLSPWDIAKKLDQLSERKGRPMAWFIHLTLAGYLAKVEELDQFIQEGMDVQEDEDLVGYEEVGASLNCGSGSETRRPPSLNRSSRVSSTAKL